MSPLERSWLGAPFRSHWAKVHNPSSHPAQCEMVKP